MTSGTNATTGPVLELVDVVKTFNLGRGHVVRAVQGVSFSVHPGETVGLIGESGSGKSTLANIALGMLPIDSGVANFEGRPWSKRHRDDLARRAEISVVFQDPNQSLNPRLTVGASICEPLITHRPNWSDAQRQAAAREAMEMAQLSADLWSRYPRELSGGQQQRVGIARAIATRPRLIVLDEPTASLDASVRKGILETMAELQRSLGLAYLLITHDMATVEALATRVVVLYRGMVVEQGDTTTVLARPRHPYTRGLMSAVLSADPRDRREHYRLRGIPEVQSADDGCVLYGRCPEQRDACLGARIPSIAVSDSHDVACVLAATPVTVGRS